MSDSSAGRLILWKSAATDGRERAACPGCLRRKAALFCTDIREFKAANKCRQHNLAELHRRDNANASFVTIPSAGDNAEIVGLQYAQAVQHANLLPGGIVECNGIVTIDRSPQNLQFPPRRREAECHAATVLDRDIGANTPQSGRQ